MLTTVMFINHPVLVQSFLPPLQDKKCFAITGTTEACQSVILSIMKNTSVAMPTKEFTDFVNELLSYEVHVINKTSVVYYWLNQVY